MVKTLPVCGTKPIPAATTSMRRQRGDVAPAERDASALDRDQAGDRLQERALAGAVRADQRDDLARRHRRPRRRARSAGRARSRQRRRSRRGAARSCRAGRRDRRRARAGRARTPAASPSQITLPCAITTIGSQTLITRSMLCSMMRNVMPRWLSSTIRSISVSSSAGLTPAAGSSSRISLRLDHQHARQLEQLLLAARRAVRRARPPCRQARTARARPSPARARRAPRAATVPPRHQLFQNRSPVCAERHEHQVLQHRHLRERARHLERAREALAEDAVRRQAADRARRRSGSRRRSARAPPQSG